jgi:nucleotide-binding universal stress UspA family protein
MTLESGNQKSIPLAIVVGFAFTDADGPAFDQAVRIAKKVQRSHLHLVHVFDAKPAQDKARDLNAHLRLYVNEKAALAGGLKGISVGIHLRAGRPMRELAQFATEINADLIVLGSHKGPHLKSWILGSTADRLLTSAPCPVLVAPPMPKVVAPHEPAIEPPCPDCLRVRAASDGADWWCERHSEHARHAHAYSYQREIPLTSVDTQIFPMGIDS